MNSVNSVNSVDSVDSVNESPESESDELLSLSEKSFSSVVGSMLLMALSSVFVWLDVQTWEELLNF